MKKSTDLAICFLVVLIIAAGTLFAQGFLGSGDGWPFGRDNSAQAEGHAITVSQVQSMPHESYSVLRGDIVQSLGRENYAFRDSTGETTVKIKNKYWGGLTAGPSNEVEILVEIKYKKDGAIEVEAKSIREI